MALLTGGAGPPVLLLHGYPQTRAAWHRIAPVLAQTHTVVVPDLPGYGESRVKDGQQSGGSKRWMARQLHAAMQSLGHERYIVIGHDRGGRVGYRMALDMPDVVQAFVSLTVVPTLDMWQGASKAFGLGAWHWFMMAQPYPLPEMLMAGDPRGLLDMTLEKMARGLEHLHPLALQDYRLAFDNPDVRHAMCEDYRAAATIDEEHDAADRVAGRRLAIPVHVLWEEGRLYGGGREPLDIWADWAKTVTGLGLGGGHLLPERASEAVLASLVPFLAQVAHDAA